PPRGLPEGLWDGARRPVSGSRSGGKAESWYTDVPQAAHATFSADGKRLAALAPDGTVKVRDVADSRQLLAVEVTNVPLVYLSRDGGHLYTTEYGRLGEGERGPPKSKHRQWDIATGKEIVPAEWGTVLKGGRLPMATDPQGRFSVGIELPEGVGTDEPLRASR